MSWLAASGSAVALVLVGLPLEQARGGTYVMRNCDVPGQPNALIGPWLLGNNPAYPTIRIVDKCAVGGGVAFTVDGAVPGGASVGLTLMKPTGAQAQIRLIKAVVWYAARLVGSGPPLRFHSVDARSDGTFVLGVSSDPPGSESVSFEQMLSPTDTAYYELVMHCGADGPAPTEACVPAAGIPVQVRGMEVTLAEDAPPVVLRPAGTLLDGGQQSGVRTLMYAASDSQSGVARIDVWLDEAIVASADLTPRCPYSGLTVCPASDDGALQIDTRNVANGTHSVRLRVKDAAGNETMTAATPIEVANAPTPNSDVYGLTASFKGSSRSTITVPYSRRVSLRGRLTRASAAALGGAQIDVLERVGSRGAREVSAGGVRTKADGSYSYLLPSKHPSRTVRLAYRPSGGSQVFSSALRLRVRAASSLQASLRGIVIHFKGRVHSGPIPKGGKRLRMEGRAPGAAWKSFASLRTDRRGRFSGRYRLRVYRPGVKLKVRVVVPGDEGYPYVTSRSRAVTLRVR